ncbi:integrin alpha-M [Brachionichthys hirsutus]|uniref:integrin alpha-M n=1 Tax=Brachionichthys hirsutus TaxID=412623 RepID=UPI003604D2F4
MDWAISAAVFLAALKSALCFNIEPVAWRTLTNRAAGFGYQVVQRRSDLLVSAPLAQYSHGERGQIYKCSATSCRRLSIPLPEFAVNASLGLTMTSDPTTLNTMVCGPTIPKDCQSITMYKGVCMQVDRSDRIGNPVPSSMEECKTQTDIAFLLDGSSSVLENDFRIMKTFVESLVESLLGKNTKFAIAQFSTRSRTHYHFNTFDAKRWETQIGDIRQLTGWTYTAAAIQHVVQDVFSPGRGSRPNAKKVLIVITDGASNDRNDLPAAAELAENRKIVRFAIGVGNAFSKVKAKRELETIASSPSANHVFEVINFKSLDLIRENLQDKIFSIEGSQLGGESLKMEMSQEGFSAAYVPEGIQMAVVGANQWRGGYVQYTGESRKAGSYEPTFLEADSYLGYSMAVAKMGKDSLTIIGAPRYQHRGIVMTVQRNVKRKKIDPFPFQFQSGEYFGAEVCTMDVDGDTDTDLIFISSPMYMEADREGRVYVCNLYGLNVECQFRSPLVLRGHSSDKGRFGSSIAVLPDLNRDGFSDLAIGAPLENDGQGSIYIFHGEGRGKISLASSQRISANEVESGLNFFGVSISQSSFDLSGDGLPDLAVGSKGKVVLLRSKPIVMVEATVSFMPNQISTQNCDRSQPLANTAAICFIMTKHSPVDEARARINYTLTLDGTRKSPSNRAYFHEKERTARGLFVLDLKRRQCFTVNFFIKACPEDSLNALYNELSFTFDALPSESNLRSSLAQQAQATSFHPLGFEVNCGPDNECIDNLDVDFNFTSSSLVKVGIDELLDVTISVKNSKEDSYNARVILTYPAGFSYRKFTILKGQVECDSMDSKDGFSSAFGKTYCTINRPIFESNAEAFFVISYGIDNSNQLSRRIFVAANATSDNQEHSSLSILYKKRWIDVKYSIFVTIESSLSYNNFTFGKNDLQKPVKQSIVLKNGLRAFNVTLVIRVPVKLGDKDIWVDSDSLFPDCQSDEHEGPVVTDFISQIQKSKLVDCSVAQCRVFRCNRFMLELDRKEYSISANLSSGWLQQIGLQAAKFFLTSTASLEYDRNQLIFFSTGSDFNPPVRKIVAEVEVYSEPDFTTEIIGGSLGGLAVVALASGGLYKAGFFKSKYQDMINEKTGEAGELGTDGGEPTPEE